MCDFAKYSNLLDTVWSNISFSVDCRFLFPADGSDGINLIRLELHPYTGIFNVNGGMVELSNRRVVECWSCVPC